MKDLFDRIKEAKEKLGDEAAEIIAKEYPLEEWNPERLSAKSIFNSNDNTPSMIWNKRDHYFKDFSTGRVFGLIDFYMSKYNEPYIKAARRMLDLAGVEYNPKMFSDRQSENKDFFKHYKYPHEEKPLSQKALDYVLKRGISEQTAKYVDLRCDENDNIAFQLRNVSGKVCAVKYRKSKAIPKHSTEPKMFWQKDADTCPLLYNMDKVDVSKPLCIVEGYFDCLAVIEAGYTNVVSINGGANDDNWIKFNYELLENFKDIILWFDNDEAGEDGLHKVVTRLGEYRVRIVQTIEEDEDAVEQYYKSFSEKSEIRKTDANNLLLACGKNRVVALINNAEAPPVKNLVYLMDSESENIADIEKFSTGIRSVDDVLYGNLMNTMTIYSGQPGVGKSSLINQAVIISALESGRSAFIYSGELSAGQILDWLIVPLAGVNHVKEVYSDRFERAFYYPTLEAAARIKKYYHDNIILYQPENELEADGDGIIEAMLNAYRRFGATVFSIDNLMSISFKQTTEESKWEQQKAFIIKLMNFTNKYDVNVNLAVHPSKSVMNSGNKPNVYSLSGSGDISNLTQRLNFLERASNNTSGPINKVKMSVLKDRPSSAAGNVIDMMYDKRTRRFFSNESELYKKYSWELNTPEIRYTDQEKETLLCNLERPSLVLDDEPF